MKINQKCARAVAAILGTHAAGAAYAVSTADQPGASTGGIEEVVVTAQRRSENAQDVPIAITAFTATDSELQPTRRYSVSASVANITDRKFLTYAPALRNPADAGLGLGCSVSRG